MKDDASISERWLDPEEFPFSQEELFDAVSLWMGSDDVWKLTEQLAKSSRDSVQMREEQLLRWRKASPSYARDPNEPRLGDFMQIDWLWPALSVLSPSTAARTEEWMAEWWKFRERMELITAQKKAAVASGGYFMGEDVLKQLRAAGVNVDRMQSQLDPRAKLPEPTSEMRRAVSEIIDAERSTWLELAAESKARLAARREA
ncbi:MAG: hypothetical protein ABIQ10_11375 [Gemmatimonadaceae bacterium]